MDGRALLDVARELASGSGEPYWRSSVGRTYYAVLHEVLGTLQRWGFSLPPRDKVHTFARLKLIYATDRDLKQVGLMLEALGQLRNAADYQLGVSGPFLSAKIAVSALADAQAAILPRLPASRPYPTRCRRGIYPPVSPWNQLRHLKRRPVSISPESPPADPRVPGGHRARRRGET